jgi:hypothetical protein
LPRQAPSVNTSVVPADTGSSGTCNRDADFFLALLFVTLPVVVGTVPAQVA